MEKRKRDVGLDVLKGILILTMIIAHVIIFLRLFTDVGFFVSRIEKFFELYGFSGFIFTYGYSNSIAYFKKEKSQVRGKYFKNTAKLMGTFYLSAIACRMICDGKGLECIPKILILADIVPFSEFIVEYAMLTLVVYIFFNPIKRILEKPWAVFATVVVSLLFCGFPYELVKCNFIGLFVGTENFSTFPVMQYFCLFILGAYAQKINLGWNYKVLLACIGASIPYWYQLIFLGVSTQSMRFPVPTVAWIAGGCATVYILYLVSRYYLNDKGVITSFLSRVGSDVPSALLISNIGLFIFSSIILGKTPLGRYCGSSLLWTGFTVFILAIVYGWTFLKPVLISKIKQIIPKKQQQAV